MCAETERTVEHSCNPIARKISMVILIAASAENIVITTTRILISIFVIFESL